MDSSSLTSEHVRAARALLRWEQKTLAARSGVSLPTIKRLEIQPGVLSAYAETVLAIRKAFEAAGIEFQNSGELGVRLRKRQRKASAKKR